MVSVLSFVLGKVLDSRKDSELVRQEAEARLGMKMAESPVVGKRAHW